MADIVTFTTDFGLEDGYVGSMKGVVLQLAPEARLIDISHMIRPQDIAAGAFVLASAYRFFPKGTVHTVVVDPGVGSSRRGLVVETPNYRFVGPDNGVLTPIYEAEQVHQIVEIQNPDLMLPEVSATFHGRDVFAPAAAHLCLGEDLTYFGAPVVDPVRLDAWQVRIENGVMTGHIVHVDHFGNCVSALSGAQIQQTVGKRSFRVQVGDRTFEPVYRTYAEAAPGRPLALYGSLGTLEISVNSGNAAVELRIKRGDEIRVVWG